jgi:ATP-dependent RNA helicase DDX24/MAK5
VAVWGIHANMQQRQRLKNLDRFRSNPRALLISSDVLARGLDVKGVDQVVHYQLPPTAETYVHRSGRTARAGAQGLSVALVGEHERETFRQLCRVLGKTGGMPSLPVDAELLPALRRRLQAARVVDRLTHRQRKLAADHNWMRRHADAMGIELEEELPRPHGRPAKRGRAGGARGALDEDDDGSGRPSISKAERRELARAQAALDALLAEPVLPRRVARSFFTLNSQLPDMSAEQVDFSSVRR